MKTYATNKKARFDYEILETFEAGIQLKGFEVKTVKQNRAELVGGFVILRGEEAYITNITIPPYQPLNMPASYDEKRARKLLLTKKELVYLQEKSQQKGLTIVPLRLYNKGGFVKMELAIVRGKKKYDKREKLKKREDTKRILRKVRE